MLRIAAALAAGLVCHQALAAAPIVLRDTEIEGDIRTMVAPVWRAAGLEPNDVGIYLVQDDQINSFVAGGQAVFINTGLILGCDTPNELIGVIAHETGHIAGGHVIRSADAMHKASIESLIALAAAALVSAAGRSAAPMIAAAGVGQQSFLRFSISQEATADHAAMKYLEATGQSARGLLKLFEKLQSQELMTGDREDSWARTHPLTAERVEYLRHQVETSRYSNVPDPPAVVELMKATKVKLHAFLDEPRATLAAYPESDRSMLARYARAIAYYRIPKLEMALSAIDGLIKDYPNDPYFRELKGQMLFENGRIKDAVQPYEQAVKLAPKSALLRISLSQVYIESGEPGLNKRAIAYLNDASRSEARESEVWHFLAVAYGRDNQMGMAALSLAEEALAGGKKKDATQQAVRAKQLLQKGSASYLRADEIGRQAEQLDN
ncbi:MAG TPA: M48 family metalloprotease [Stellaceae bacterium]|jgi:predicted Zn-dependent protease|nr:M48 family metalloprotease [Stellaceae bacterium]